MDDRAAMPARLLAIRRLTPAVCELELELSGFQCRPGQYVDLQLTDQKGSFSRPFSIAEHDGDRIRLCITTYPRSRTCAALCSALTGNSLTVSPAQGDFTLADTAQASCFIAAGAGLAPMLPMLAASSGEVQLLAGFRKASDLFYREKIAEFANVQPHFTLTQAETDWEGLSGRVTDHLDQLSWDKETAFYICGKPAMVADVRQGLLDKGVDDARIHTERFTPATPDTPAATPKKTPPQLPPGVRMKLAIRNLHFYASLSMCALFLFFAATGLVANRQDWLNHRFGSEAKVPKVSAEALVDVDSMRTALKQHFPAASIITLDDEGDGFIALLHEGKSELELFVDRESQVIELDRYDPLPAGLAKDVDQTIAWLRERYPGNLDRDSIDAEDDDPTIRFELESVWHNHSFEVDREANRFRVNRRDIDFISAVVNLHRGKVAGTHHKLLMDLTAAVLFVVTLSGLSYGLLSGGKRRVTALTLLACSLVMLGVLIWGR